MIHKPVESDFKAVAKRDFDGMTTGGNWNHSWRKGRREDQPMCRKQRWVKKFQEER